MVKLDYVPLSIEAQKQTKEILQRKFYEEVLKIKFLCPCLGPSSGS